MNSKFRTKNTKFEQTFLFLSDRTIRKQLCKVFLNKLKVIISFLNKKWKLINNGDKYKKNYR